MKVSVNKNGFTLMELLVVIAIVSLLMLFATASISEYFDKSIDKSMEIQENEIVDSMKLYLNDYCDNPISGAICEVNSEYVNGTRIYNDKVDIDLLISKEYLDEVVLKDVVCDGYVEIINNDISAFLSCEDSYTTEGYSYD